MLVLYATAPCFSILFGAIAVRALGFAIYVRIQPPTVIRVDKMERPRSGCEKRSRSTSKLACCFGRGPSAIRIKFSSAHGSRRESRQCADSSALFVVHARLRYAKFCESLNMMTSNLRS